MANRLADAPSPYLLQHKDNPVDWWPWCDEAFEEARRRDVPVFLSIGYATCHWCHVMAHESFEDDDVAAVMNEAFVNIKVDREERPDLDDMYMAVCQAMNGSGGWPLTVLLTPERKPFFAGTYFPRSARGGRIGMLELVPRVKELWRKKRGDLESQATHLLAHVASGGEGGDLADDVHAKAVATFRKRFDAERGGFGGPPKFPSPANLLYLLRRHHAGDQTLDMVVKTLDAMAAGGIHDHIGGGFHRYSTDVDWFLPHFEKMLYDQAMLAIAYLEAFQVTGDTRHAEVAKGIFAYVERDLHTPDGYASAEDADSEGEEGRFYTWTLDELRAALGDEADVFARRHGATADGNFLDEATHTRNGRNILVPTGPDTTTYSTLLAARSKRIRPLRDDKVLADWNALYLAALAVAGRVLGAPYDGRARRLAGQIDAGLRLGGKLRHRRRGDALDEVSFLDDHAYLLWATIELALMDGDPKWIAKAKAEAEALGAFAAEDGGYYNARQSPDLLVRRREAFDGALPSGNGVAAWNLARLAAVTGDVRHAETAARTVHAFGAQASSHPAAFPTILMAADQLARGIEVVVVGDDRLWGERRGYHPTAVWLRAAPALAKVAPWTAEHRKPGAYVCRDFACQAPSLDVAALRRALSGPAPTTPRSRPRAP